MKEKTFSIFDKVEWELNHYFYSELEKEIWEWKRCFNCEFCGDVSVVTWNIKDAVIECLWINAWISNINIGNKCYFHKYIDKYSERKKWD